MKLNIKSTILALCIPTTASAAINWGPNGNVPDGNTSGTLGPVITSFSLKAFGNNANLTGDPDQGLQNWIDGASPAVLTEIGESRINFDGLTVNGGAKQGIKANLTHLNNKLTNSRVTVETTQAYLSGDVLNLTWSYDNPMTTVSPAYPAGPGYAGSTGESYNGSNLTDAGRSGTFRIDMFFAGIENEVSGVKLNLEGNNIGLTSNEFASNFTSAAAITLDSNGVNNASFDYDNTTLLSSGSRARFLDEIGLQGTVDYDISKFSFDITLDGDIAAGTQFIFTFDGAPTTVITPVPEPTSTAILGLGTLLLTLRRKR